MTDAEVIVIIESETWYLRKIDSTHLSYSIDPHCPEAAVAHVAQLKNWGDEVY